MYIGNERNMQTL